MLFQDLKKLDERICQLQHDTVSATYQKKRASLQLCLTNFFDQLPHTPTLLSATPLDIQRFLVWKDSCGKTQIHDKLCTFLGESGVMSCQCPIRLASGTVEGLIQHLVDIFDSVGRGRVWNATLALGNPASSDAVKKYLKAVKEEQARAHVVPKQAKPIFIDKIRKIAEYIDRELSIKDLPVKQKYVLLRDQALIKLQFFAGDRASDVAIILSQEVKKLHDDKGFVFKHTFGKTLRGGSNKCNTFVIKRCDEKIICPVFGLESYFSFMQDHCIPLFPGYLFRIITETGRILDKPVSYTSIYERLKTYLVTLGIFDGETPHSLRAGCAITLAYSECKTDIKGIMNHVGWSTEKTTQYYTRASVIKDASLVADNLAKCADTLSKDSNDSFYELFSDFDDLQPAFS